jgi:hypothetical protein
MCEPATLMAIGSTLMGAFGQIQQAQAASAAGKYNAQVAEMNATLADRRARDALERGKVDEQRKRNEVAAIKGKQMAAMAANGVDLGFGSPLDTLIDTATLGEIDALTVRTNAARESYDHSVDAVNKRAGATLSNMQARSALQGGYLNAAGTILTGGSKAYQSYSRANGVGSIS